MKVLRSASQILFGHLPEQTLDADGGIWKVSKWINPKTVSSIDSVALREELIRSAYAWKETQKDGGFVDDLHAHTAVSVKSLNRDEGVWCQPFPRLYLCQVCSRLHDDSSSKCECGSTRRRGQLPFVGYHDVCGGIKSPWVGKCPVHGQRAMKSPGTASTAELTFYCPVCKVVFQQGFAAKCDCNNGTLKFTVHRSGTVFKPRGISMINPPRRDILQSIEQAGGGERALEWVLSGLESRQLTESSAARNPDSIRKLLEDRGFDSATIDAMIAAMPPDQSAQQPTTINLAPGLRADAERHAKQIALATFESRITLDDLLKKTTNPQLKKLYQVDYVSAMKLAGMERVELIDRFPVLTAQFGFTRGDSTPGNSRLRTYRETNGEYTVYGELSQTEALFIRLNPKVVYAWLIRNGHTLAPAQNKRACAEAILSAMSSIDLAKSVTQLVHSFSHAFIKRAAVFAGIEKSSLSEIILPTALSFFVYAAPKGDFVLGGLQVLLESELHHLLQGFIEDDYRCALDPGCEDTGAACAVCLHLGEPSCQLFNTALSRKVLAGPQGYLDVAAQA